jgi:hypothetical protein
LCRSLVCCASESPTSFADSKGGQRDATEHPPAQLAVALAWQTRCLSSRGNAPNRKRLTYERAYMTKHLRLPGLLNRRFRQTSLLSWASAARAAWAKVTFHQRPLPEPLTFDELALEVLLQLREVPEHRAIKDPVATLGRIVEPLARRTSPTAPLVPAEVDLILSELPDVTRTVLRLHLGRALHFREIGKQLGLPADVALEHLRRALTHMRVRLGDRDS